MKRISATIILLTSFLIFNIGQKRVTLNVGEQCYTEVNTITSGFDIDVYPNPNNGNFTIQFNNPITTNDLVITIFDLNGTLMVSYSFQINSSKVYIQDVGLNAGAYLLEIRSKDFLSIKKLIIQ